MKNLNLDINAKLFQESLLSSITEPGSLQLIRIIGNIVLQQIELQLEKEIQAGNIIRYKASWYRPSMFVEREMASLFELIKKPTINLGYYVIDVTTYLGGSCDLNINPPKNLFFYDDVKIKAKILKTVCKYKIRLYGIGIKSGLLTPVVQLFDSPCKCPPNYLVPHIDGVWDFALQFFCKVCGKAYICECFRQALEKKYAEIKSNKSGYGIGSLDRRIVSAIDQSTFRDGICHLCRDISSEIKFCHPQYGSKVLVHYGPYIYKTAIEKNINHSNAENEIRELLGIPRIGEGWISEVELLNLVKQIFPDQEVIHQASPDWLGRQRIDVFIPGKNIAIEYQGRQHYEPVEFFGGKEGFIKTQKRDKHKADLCADNSIDLIYFRYDEAITKQLVKNRINNIC